MPEISVTESVTASSKQQPGLSVAITALSLHQVNAAKGGRDGKQSFCSSKRLALTTKISLAEPEAPEVCTSPRIPAMSTAASHAALQRQHSTPCKPAAAKASSARSQTLVQPLRKSADAIPSRKTSSSLTGSPLRHSRRQSSLSRSTDGVLGTAEAHIAAIRRSRVTITYALGYISCLPFSTMPPYADAGGKDWHQQ